VVDSVVVADFDGDGIPDLVAGSTGAPAILLSRGLGGGAFGPALSLPASAQGAGTVVTSGDFDGDGQPDVAAIVRGLPGSAVVFLNRGGGLVKTSETPLATLSPAWYNDDLTWNWGASVAADLNGDFAVDLAVTQVDYIPNPQTALAGLASMQILPGDGAGGLGPAQVVLNRGHAPFGTLWAGDITARDRTDLFAGGLVLPNTSVYCCEVRQSQPAVDKATLWPPSGDMVPVTISYTAKSNCSKDVSCAVSVSGGDSSVIDAHHVLLRAQREGNGSGRTYTLTVSCSDGAGGGATRTATVNVPHDQRPTK
jgi:hypothetical protein